MTRLVLVASVLVLVIAACGGSRKAAPPVTTVRPVRPQPLPAIGTVRRLRVPKGITEIDVHTPRISRRVTGASQVRSIVGWLDALERPGKIFYCAGGWGASVRFTFRSASGAEVARAFAAPESAGPCDPIHFDVPGKPEMFLVDDTHRGTGFIDRVKRLLGMRSLGPSVYFG